MSGRAICAFTDAEEEKVGRTANVPFLLETELRRRGALFQGAADFQEKVVVSDRLLTGQNPNSARGLAEAVVQAISKNAGAAQSAASAAAAKQQKQTQAPHQAQQGSRSAVS